MDNINELSLEQMKDLYGILVKRYNNYIDGINDTFSNLLYLEQFPIIMVETIDEDSLNKILNLGNRINELEDGLKSVKKEIKELVNTANDKFDEDIMDEDKPMLERMTLVSDSVDNVVFEDINKNTLANIDKALEFAKDQDEETAKKLAGYAAVMRILVSERSKDLEK